MPARFVLDYQGVVEHARTLASVFLPWPFGAWKRAATELARDGSPEAMDVLAQAYAHARAPGLRSILEGAILSVDSPGATERLWSNWMSLRCDALAEVLCVRPLRLPCPIALYVLSRLKSGLVEELRRQGGVDVVAELVQASSDRDQSIATRAAWVLREMANGRAAAEALADALAAGGMNSRSEEAVRSALDRVQSQGAIDGVCLGWMRRRSHSLAALMRKKGWLAGSPMEAWVLTRLAFRPEALEGAPHEAARCVLQACEDADPQVALRALAAMRLYGDQSSPEAKAWREALCEAVVADGCGQAARAEMKALGVAPADPERRAVYLLLTDQFEAALDLDFDQSMLSEAYRGSEAGLRRRIAAAIRRSRSRDLFRILMRRQGDTYEHLEMNDLEWETVISAVDAPGRRDELWSLMLDAPAAWSVVAFDRLRSAGWQPAEDAQGVWQELCGLRSGVRPDADWSFLDEGSVAETLGLKQFEWVLRDPRSVWTVGRTTAAACGETVWTWDLAAGQPLGKVNDLPAPVKALAVSTDGRRLVVGHGQRLDVREGPEMARVSRWETGPYSTMALSGDGKRLVTQGAEGRAYWDVDTGRSVPMQGAKDFDAVALSWDGRWMALLKSSEWRLYDVDTRRSMDVFREVRLESMQPQAREASFSPDGRWLAVRTWVSLDLYGVPGGQKRQVVRGRTSCPAWSADARMLACEVVPEVVGRSGRFVVVWDVGGAREAYRFEMPRSLVRQGAGPGEACLRGLWFSTDGRHILGIASSGAIVKWRLMPTPLAAIPMSFVWESEAGARGAEDGEEEEEEVVRAAAPRGSGPSWMGAFDPWGTLAAREARERAEERARGRSGRGRGRGRAQGSRERSTQKWVRAVLGFRCRYDIELGDVESGFVAEPTDVEIDFG